MMPRFDAAPRGRTRDLAALTAVAAWVLIVVGGFVRVSGSGMGCPDWPRCYGSWVPQNAAAWIEMIHRYIAGIVSALVGVTFVSAWINRRRFPGALWAAAAAVLVIVVQIALGAWTVATGNRGDTVVAHLVAALLLLGAAAWTAVRSSARPYGRYRRPDAMAVRRRLAALAVVLAPVTLLVAGLGGAVQVVNGGLACPDFPFCGGALWPAGRGLPAELHMLHRAGAAGIGALLVVGAIWAWRLDRGPERLWLTLSLGLYAVQFAVGVAQVTLGMPFELRWAHLALAAALWGTVGTFTAYAVDGYVPAGLPEPRMSARLPGREAGA